MINSLNKRLHSTQVFLFFRALPLCMLDDLLEHPVTHGLLLQRQARVNAATKVYFRGLHSSSPRPTFI